MDRLSLLQLASAGLGFIGTALLFFFGYSLRPFEGATWGNEHTAARNEKIRRDNARDLYIQKWGFALLCLSFLLQVITILVPPTTN